MTAVAREMPEVAALRDRIAAALYERERPHGGLPWPAAFAADRDVFEPMADAVLAALGAPVDLAAELAGLRAELDKLIRWHKEDGDQAVTTRATIGRLRAERAELGRQLDCIRGDMRDMEAHVREQDAEFERLRGGRAAVIQEVIERLETRTRQAPAPGWRAHSFRDVRDTLVDDLRSLADEAQQPEGAQR